MWEAGSGPPFWVYLLSAAPFTLLALPYATLGIIFVFKGGDDVDKSNRIAQLYGYTVCLIAIIVSLLSIASLLDAAYQRANPLQSEMSYGAAMTSFEAYKATYHRERAMFDRDGASRPDTMSDVSLRQQYDALAADRTATTRYRTSKTLTTSGILLVIALVLFALHWRWVRRVNGTPTATA